VSEGTVTGSTLCPVTINGARCACTAGHSGSCFFATAREMLYPAEFWRRRAEIAETGIAAATREGRERIAALEADFLAAENRADAIKVRLARAKDALREIAAKPRGARRKAIAALEDQL
jgi:hypothetical protein